MKETLEERKVVALESIAKSLSTIGIALSVTGLSITVALIGTLYF